MAPPPVAAHQGLPQPLPVGSQRRAAPVVGAAPGGGRGQQSTERLGTGELLVQRRVKKQAGGGNDVDLTTDYDFEEMNAKLDRARLTEECTGNPQLQTVEVGYRPKSSFFDSISCETLDRQKTREQSERKGFAEMRKQ